MVSGASVLARAKNALAVSYSPSWVSTVPIRSSTIGSLGLIRRVSMSAASAWPIRPSVTLSRARWAQAAAWFLSSLITERKARWAVLRSSASSATSPTKKWAEGVLGSRSSAALQASPARCKSPRLSAANPCCSQSLWVSWVICRACCDKRLRGRYLRRRDCRPVLP